MNDQRPGRYLEAHSALNGALLAFGLLPLAAEAACLILGVTTSQPWFFVLMGPLFVLVLISVGLLYRNWPTGVRVDESGISIGAVSSARLVTLDELTPVDLVVMGCVAVGEDGARLGKGGGFADLEFALATAAGLIGPHTVTVTTVHEIQLRPAGVIPLTSHDIALDFIVTADRVIDCRSLHPPRPDAVIAWDDLTEDKIAAIPLLGALRPNAATDR